LQKGFLWILPKRLFPIIPGFLKIFSMRRTVMTNIEARELEDIYNAVMDLVPALQKIVLLLEEIAQSMCDNYKPVRLPPDDRFSVKVTDEAIEVDDQYYHDFLDRERALEIPPRSLQ
jgi:hypothetical protein